MATDKRQSKDPDKAKPGPEPETLKIEGDWKQAMQNAMKKKKPKEGWPDVAKRDEGQEKP